MFFFSWTPALFSLIAEPVTGLVDSAFIAHLGADSLAALGVGVKPLSSAFRLFNFPSFGSPADVSQDRGKGNIGQTARIGGLALGARLALMILGLLFASRAAALMGATNAVHGREIVSR